MKRIIKISIVYTLAALLLAQPIAQGMSLNQVPTLVKEATDSLKPYITVENCIKATVIGGIAAFLGYIFLKNKASRYFRNNNKFPYPTESGEIPVLHRDHIRLTVKRIYENRTKISKRAEHYSQQIGECLIKAKNNRRLYSLLIEFQAAFKQYCADKDDNADLRITNSYDAIIETLK